MGKRTFRLEFTIPVYAPGSGGVPIRLIQSGAILLIAAGIWMIVALQAVWGALIGAGVLLVALAVWYWRKRRSRYSRRPERQPKRHEGNGMASLETLQRWYTSQIGTLIIENGIHCDVSVVRGPFQMTYKIRIVQDLTNGVARLMRLEAALEMAVQARVRLVRAPAGVLLEIELPKAAHVTPNAAKLAGYCQWPNVPIGIDQYMKPVVVNPETHGALYWIAPPRSGKTESMRSTLAMLVRNVPEQRFVIFALAAKITKNWGVFDGVDGCLGLVSSPEEMDRAMIWLVDEMNAGRYAGKTFVVLDDLTNLTSVSEIGGYLNQIALAGPGLGYHLMVGTHGAGSKATTGGSLVNFAMTCRLLYRAADSNSAARSAGRRNAETGISQLSGQPGDAILDDNGRITRVATAWIRDVDVLKLPARTNKQRPWSQVAVTSHGSPVTSHSVPTTTVTSGGGDLSRLSRLSRLSLPIDGAPALAARDLVREGTAGVVTSDSDSDSAIVTLPRIMPERDPTSDEAVIIAGALAADPKLSISAVADTVYGARNTRRVQRIRRAVESINSSNDMSRDLAVQILESGVVDDPRRAEALVFLAKEVKIEGKGWNDKGRPKPIS